MAEIISGKEISYTIREEISLRVKKLSAKGIVPGLAVILVGDDAASNVYVNMKEKACVNVGINSFVNRLPADTSQNTVLDLVKGFNEDDKVHGILIQHPLPPAVDESYVFSQVDPRKDVDGFHPVNAGKLLIGAEGFVPCTPLGVVEMLHRSGNPPAGKHVVIVGRSSIVGKPLAALLVQKNDRANATVTICHSRTIDLPEITKTADILIAAIGVPEFITADMVKKGAVVIDVGTNRVEDSSREKGYRLTGDVHFEEVEKIAKAISPVPFGVGPMTITMLLHNTTLSAEKTLH
ncbi:bifunctional methylenetetrahydrofolate dehydrogenase/methenyltetrahydrofolate cyclohydrolase FolD [candidate division KSB1 bacterium]|nr:bifunctional methylenetetrahydrofolate dehydrogenase/methenyltetrahydrofolate cyclohydrolase FolD [candidate division KSB1 bacterium]